MSTEAYHQATVVFTDAPTRDEGVVYRAQCRCRWLGPWQKTQALAEDDATAHEDANNARGGRWRQGYDLRDRPVLVKLPNGQSIDPALLVCPQCHRFELRVRLSTANPREYMATDDSGHTWTFDPTASPWTTWHG